MIFESIQKRLSSDGSPSFIMDIVWLPCSRLLWFLGHSLMESLLPWRKEASEPSPTAFLDGIRGYASLFVSFYHLRNGYMDSVHIGYGASPDATSLLQLPLARLLFAGQAMVTVFFLVSGYSLSLGTFKSLKGNDPGKALERIRSGIFRRFLRLYLPTIASSFLVLVCISIGLYDWGHQMDDRSGYREPEPQIYDNFGMQLVNWIKETSSFCNVFEQPRHLYYPHSWSIPVEFVKSIQLYLFLIAMCKLKALPRAAIHFLAIGYSYYYSANLLWTFLVGAGLAHLSVLSQSQPVDKDPRIVRWMAAFKITFFVYGLYMLSYPEWSGPDTPGYRYLTPLLPGWWNVPATFIYTVGAAIVTWTVSSTNGLCFIFSCNLARYLGRISFALYLVHGIVIHMLGLWLLPLIWRMTGRDTVLKTDVGYFLGLLAYIPICLVFADVFTRLVDEPCVRFARWLETKLIPGPDRSGGEYQRLPMVELASPILA